MKNKRVSVHVSKRVQEQQYEPWELGITAEADLEGDETYQEAADALYGEAMEALSRGFLRRAAELDMDREALEKVLGEAATKEVVEDEDGNELDDINLDL